MEKKKNIFKELSSVSIKDKTDKKGKFSYLSWATAWSMIKTEHPTAQRKVYESEHTGLNFFSDGSTAYVKVGITINDLEHIDYLPVMDYRNKAIAMHGLGLSLWIGEDTIISTKPTSTPVSKTPVPSKSSHIELNIGDENFAKVLRYVSDNKELGLPKIVKNLEAKYKIKSLVKKEISKYIK